MKKKIGFILVFIIGALVGFTFSKVISMKDTKLKNEKKIVASIDGHEFSSSDLYNKLKNNNGMDALLELIDVTILNEKYDLKDEASKYAKEESENVYKMYEQNYGYKKEDFLSSNGFKSEEAFLNYLEEDFLYKRYYEDYLKSKIKDKDIKKYYDSKVKGAKKIYVISNPEDNKDLDKIKKELDKGLSIKNIEKKYPNAIINDIGKVDFTSYSSYSDTFISNLNKTKKNKSSKVFNDDSFGYALIYVYEEEKKKEYDDIKDEIKSVLASNLGEDDDTLFAKAFIELRRSYHLEINDKTLYNEYKKLKKQYK